MTDLYKKNIKSWSLLLDKASIAAAIITVSVDDKGMPVDVQYPYVNSEYAKLYEIEVSDHMGKSIYEIDNNVDKKYVYNVWDCACNGVKKEFSFWGEWVNKYLKCNMSQLEYGLCLVFLVDDTINAKLRRIVDKNYSTIQKNNGVDYIFVYNPGNDLFIYSKNAESKDVIISSGNCVYDFKKKIKDFGQEYVGFNEESAIKAFCDPVSGIHYVMLASKERQKNKLKQYRVASWPIYMKDGTYEVMGTILTM